MIKGKGGEPEDASAWCGKRLNCTGLALKIHLSQQQQVEAHNSQLVGAPA